VEQLYVGAAGIGRQMETERHPRGRQWREIRSAAPYPLLGEDARTWVSRTRREGDEDRGSEEVLIVLGKRKHPRQQIA
jgi:hypothetical protein